MTVSNGVLNTGKIDLLNLGALNVVQDWTNNSVLNIAAGGALTGGTLTNLANGTITGSGFIKNLVVNQARMDFGGTVSNNFLQTDGSFTLSGNGTITGSANINGGTLDLLGNRLADGLLAISGTGVLTSAVAGATVGGGLSNAAMVAVTADTFFTGATTNTGSFYFRGTISNNLVNSGIVKLNNDATVTGTASITGGTFDFSGRSYSNGLMVVSGIGVVTNSVAGANFNGDLNLLNRVLTGATVTNRGAISGTGTIAGSIINLSTFTASSGGTLTITTAPVQNGNVNVSGTLNVVPVWTNSVSVTVTLSGGVITGGMLVTQGRLRGSGTIVPNVVNSGTVLANASQPLVFGGLLVNQTNGVVSANGGRLAVNGIVTNRGTFTMLNSIGTFNSGVINSGAWVTDPTTNVFNNTLTVTSSGFIQMSAGDVYIFSNTTPSASDFVNLSTNNTQYETSAGKFLFSGGLSLTQTFYTAGHNLGPSATNPTNALPVFGATNAVQLLDFPGYSNNFALGTLEISDFSTVRVSDAFIGMPSLGTNDGLVAGLYLSSLVLGPNPLLVIDTNVQVYFVNSNNWSLANIRLLNNQSPDFGGDAFSYNNTINGLHQLVLVPEPNVLRLWSVGALTVCFLRRRGRSKDKRASVRQTR